jgi:glycine cleavage system aminomethyltransferase T
MGRKVAIKQTALFHTHREAGAKMSEYFGYQMPTAYSDSDKESEQVRQSAGIADISYLSIFNFQGRGLKSPPDLGPEASLWQLGQRQYLLTCHPAARDAVMARLHEFQKSAVDPSLPPPIYVTEVTSAYTQILLAGPRSRDVLNKLTSLNLAESVRGNLTCAQASVAHVHAIVLRKDLPGIPAYHLLVGREYGESVWESVMHAGHEFHVTPFGLEAQQRLQG